MFINILLEYGEQGVKTFAFHPGCILTELASNSTFIVDMVKKGMTTEDSLALPASALVRLTSGSEDWLSGRYVVLFLRV